MHVVAIHVHSHVMLCDDEKATEFFLDAILLFFSLNYSINEGNSGTQILQLLPLR